MIALLQRLAARHLEPGEIVAASLRRNAAGYAPLLRTIKDATAERFMVSVGTNPYYTATVRHIPLPEECDEDRERFEKKLGEIAKVKPESKAKNAERS